MSLSPLAPSVLAMYPCHASAAAATEVLQRAGVDGRRLTVVSFGEPFGDDGPYFVLARGSADVLTHARIVLTTPRAPRAARYVRPAGVVVH